MLNKNVGLRDICHSITGGALVAQGYWIPYLSAKHIAATFCFSIRHALTPVFGLDFIDLCVPPSDPRFGSMLIDAAVVTGCKEEAKLFKRYEIDFPLTRPVGLPASRAGSPSRATTPIATCAGKKGKQQTASSRFEPVNANPYTKANTNNKAASGFSSSSDVDNTSSSEQDSSNDDTYLISPANTLSPSSASPIFGDVWNAKFSGMRKMALPRSHPRGNGSGRGSMDDDLPSPKSMVSNRGQHEVREFGGEKRKRNFTDFQEGWMIGFEAARTDAAMQQGTRGSAYSTPMQSPKLRKLMQMEMGVGMGLGLRGLNGGIDMDVEMEEGYEAEGEEMEVERTPSSGVGSVSAARRYHGDATKVVQAADVAAGSSQGFGDKEAATTLLTLWGVNNKGTRRAST